MNEKYIEILEQYDLELVEPTEEEYVYSDKVTENYIISTDPAAEEPLKKGDTITTIGGIVGKVVQVNNETIVIETSDDRVRMELTKWAVSTTGVQSSGEEKSSKEEKKEDEVKKTEEIPEAPAEETDASSEEEKKD